MIQRYDNSTGHIIAAIEGQLMLVDTGANKTFYDEYQGVRIIDLARMVGQPLDGVLGMDSLEGKVLSITRNTINVNGLSPENEGAPLSYIAGIPCVDIKVNEIPCRAAIKTGVATSYVSEKLISRDKYTRTINDAYPFYGKFKVKMFVNYFSVSNKSYFADVGELPGEFATLTTADVDVVIGADLLNRFNMILDFSANRLHLVSGY